MTPPLLRRRSSALPRSAPGPWPGRGRPSLAGALGLSALSGLLLAASMPNFDLEPLAWVAMVPLGLALDRAWGAQRVLWPLPFGLVWSLAVHAWYPQVLSPALGWFLMLAVGAFYAGTITLGVALQARLPAGLRLLALPVTWAAIEFLRFVGPGVQEWWFVLLAKGQWRFPPALQVLSLTGFPGLSFLILLANGALTALLLGRRGRPLGPGTLGETPRGLALGALALVGASLAWGALRLPDPPEPGITVVALTDLVNQDPATGAGSKASGSGYLAARPAISQAIFDLDAALTRRAASRVQADFVVWPENEFAQVTDAGMMAQLGALAAETQAFLVADVVSTASGHPAADLRAARDLYDTAILYGPEGRELGRRAKIEITPGEARHGFVSGPRTYPVFATPHGKVGLGVCWDRHRPFVTRELARSGARIVLMPVDDDFHATPWFPAYHASDAVFRAVENRVAFATGTTNGLSVIVDPYGRIVAEGEINQRGVIVGEVFTVSERTLYTRWGDWFGGVLGVGLLGLAGVALLAPGEGSGRWRRSR